MTIVFNLDELKMLLKKYNDLYEIVVENDYFSLVFDNYEGEWFYIINEQITQKQLVDALNKFEKYMLNTFGEKQFQENFKLFTITDYIDTNTSMMRDKNLYRLYAKFHFMYPSFYDASIQD